MSLTIDFQIIDHSEQRYDTVGDYWVEVDESDQHWHGQTWHFRISRMYDHRYHWLVFLHEFIEAALLHCAGIPWVDVDRFDREYEAAREAKIAAPCGCKPTKTSEPGADKHAPYRRAHQVATLAERAAAKLLGVSWRKYNAAVESL